MNAHDAIRFLEHEAEFWRNVPNATRDEIEAFALHLPSLLRVLRLPPMDDTEAAAFRRELYNLLTDFRYDPRPSRVGCS